MDISSLTAVAGALGLGTVIGAFINQWGLKLGRAEERAAGRDEHHRDQLRHAYADFIAAFSRFVDAAGLLYAINEAIDTLPNDVYRQALETGSTGDEAVALAEDAVTDELRERGRKAVEDFSSTSMDANTKAVAVLLLEDDPVRKAKAQALADAQLVPPQTPTDGPRFKADIDKVRTLLNELSDSLGGSFSPDRWHTEVAARRALEKAAPKQITQKAG